MKNPSNHTSPKDITSLPVIHMKPAEGGKAVRPLTAEEQEHYEPPDEALEGLARFLYPVIRAYYENG